MSAFPLRRHKSSRPPRANTDRMIASVATLVMITAAALAIGVDRLLRIRLTESPR